MTRSTFAHLCAAMDVAGVEVHVLLTDEGGHAIRLLDHHRLRSLELPVRRGFDAEALIACCSLAICPTSPRAREWPELVAVAHDFDLEVSDRGRPERLS